MKEWHRTVILVVLIAVAIGYLIWAHHTLDASLLSGI